MPKHIVRLIVLILVFGGGAYAAKIFFTKDSFYVYGHYRGDSVAEIASDKPKFKGSEYCQPCHAEQYAVWSKGVHHGVDAGKVVQCEVCHGAAGGRDAGGMFQHVATGVDHPGSGKLPIPSDTLKLCPLCHEKMPGRPAEQRQIDIATHAGTQQCTTCHNPHSPRLFVAAAKPGEQLGNAPDKAAVCAGCHGGNGMSTNPAWPSLAGQHSAYLVGALKAYKTGARENAMMAATAKGLTDADMQNLASHYAALKIRAAASGGVAQDVAAGKAKAAACAACHGANGVSNNPVWPSLAGQQRDYLLAALKAYRDGSRKNEMMSGMAKGLSDADMEALATYYSSASVN
jgi:cytochrome c553